MRYVAFMVDLLLLFVLFYQPCFASLLKSNNDFKIRDKQEEEIDQLMTTKKKRDQVILSYFLISITLAEVPDIVQDNLIVYI